MKHLLISVALTLWVFTGPTWSDTIGRPSERLIPSPNARYLFQVVPHVERSQPNASEPIQHDAIPSTTGSPEVCYGTLFRYEKNGGQYAPVWRAPLADRIAPAHVIVADDGESVVTLGQWMDLKDHDHHVAVYGPDGRLLRKLTLNELYSKEEIAALPHSSPAKFWNHGSHLDAAKHLFILKLAGERLVRIDLRTGELVSSTE